MSAWGRAQDALHDVLWGYDTGRATREEGLMAKLGITYTEARDKCPEFEETILEALASVVGYWTAIPPYSDESSTP